MVFLQTRRNTHNTRHEPRDHVPQFWPNNTERIRPCQVSITLQRGDPSPKRPVRESGESAAACHSRGASSGRCSRLYFVAASPRRRRHPAKALRRLVCHPRQAQAHRGHHHHSFCSLQQHLIHDLHQHSGISSGLAQCRRRHHRIGSRTKFSHGGRSRSPMSDHHHRQPFHRHQLRQLCS